MGDEVATGFPQGAGPCAAAPQEHGPARDPAAAPRKGAADRDAL